MKTPRSFSPVKILSGILSSLTLHATAQTADTQSLYWIRYQNQLNFSPSLYSNIEIDNRRFLGEDVQNQLILHSRLHHRRGPWDMAGGLTLSWAFASMPERPVRHPVLEIRPVAEVSHEARAGMLTISNRLRADNRFIETDAGEGVFGNTDYTLRVRYRLQVRIPVSAGEKTSLSIRLADEIMVNHRENFFDQNRIYATADWRLSEKFTLEWGYIHIWQQRFGTDDFLRRHVIRFTVLHRLFIRG